MLTFEVVPPNRPTLMFANRVVIRLDAFPTSQAEA